MIFALRRDSTHLGHVDWHHLNAVLEANKSAVWQRLFFLSKVKSSSRSCSHLSIGLQVSFPNGHVLIVSSPSSRALSLLPSRSRHVAPPHEFSNVTEILLGPQTDPKLDAIRADKPRCLDLPTTYPAIDSIPADAQFLRCLNCRIRFHLLLC